LGITINLRLERGRELFRELVRVSDAVTENFSAGVMERLGFGYETLRKLRADIVYVSNSGFGHSGPYGSFKTWGPAVQAISGLTFQSGLPDLEPAGWGYSYMDHSGAYFMAVALLAALFHRRRTGQGQWVDLACSEAAATLNGPAVLDFAVNGRRTRSPGRPHSNRSEWPRMAPHGIYPARGDDEWVAIACRSDEDWLLMADVIAEPWAKATRWEQLTGRLTNIDELDRRIAAWTKAQTRAQIVEALRDEGVPAAPVSRPSERCDLDLDNRSWNLFPMVTHTRHGAVRVDGLPVHLSLTDWRLERGGPLLGEHNKRVFGEILGLSHGEISVLADEGVI
jgi:crotonobetainyl-CoA:carnitine CoA-transferase CaiB-like acyl-CoA transferase